MEKNGLILNEMTSFCYFAILRNEMTFNIEKPLSKSKREKEDIQQEINAIQYLGTVACAWCILAIQPRKAMVTCHRIFWH